MGNFKGSIKHLRGRHATIPDSTRKIGCCREQKPVGSRWLPDFLLGATTVICWV